MAKGERIQNMTQGVPAKLIFSFAIPLMLGNVFQQFYTVVDTAIVGQALGVHALAAIGAADWLNWLVLGMVQGFAQGFSIYMAQRFGADDHEGLNRSIGATVSLAAVISVVLLAISQVTMKPVLMMMNTPQEVMGGALIYLRIMFAGIPIIMAYNVLASILRALGDSKTPLYAMVAASVLNIVLDLLFVMAFHWGIAGAVVATVLAQLFAAIYCLRAVMKIRIIKLKKEYLLPERFMARRLLGLGMPVALQNMIIAVGGMVVQTVVNRYGVLFVAGFTATNKLYGILEIAATSFAVGVGYHYGVCFPLRSPDGEHVYLGNGGGSRVLHRCSGLLSARDGGVSFRSLYAAYLSICVDGTRRYGDADGVGRDGVYHAYCCSPDFACADGTGWHLLCGDRGVGRSGGRFGNHLLCAV